MDEKGVSAQFREVFSERFHLYPECYLKHPLIGKRCRIDYIGFDRKNQMQGPLGFEIKDELRWTNPNESYNKFSRSLAQACDYQSMLIDSEFDNEDHKLWFHERLRFTFMGPMDYRWAYMTRYKHGESVHGDWAQGSLRAASFFGVGSICNDPKNGWMLTMATHPAFFMRSGPTDLYFKHATSTRTGSAR